MDCRDGRHPRRRCDGVCRSVPSRHCQRVPVAILARSRPSADASFLPQSALPSVFPTFLRHPTLPAPTLHIILIPPSLTARRYTCDTGQTASSPSVSCALPPSDACPPRLRQLPIIISYSAIAFFRLLRFACSRPYYFMPCFMSMHFKIRLSHLPKCLIYLLYLSITHDPTNRRLPFAFIFAYHFIWSFILVLLRVSSSLLQISAPIPGFPSCRCYLLPQTSHNFQIYIPLSSFRSVRCNFFFLILLPSHASQHCLFYV